MPTEDVVQSTPIVRQLKNAIPLEDRLPMDGSGSQYKSIEDQTSKAALRADLDGEETLIDLVRQSIGEGEQDDDTQNSQLAEGEEPPEENGEGEEPPEEGDEPPEEGQNIDDGVEVTLESADGSKQKVKLADLKDGFKKASELSKKVEEYEANFNEVGLQFHQVRSEDRSNYVKALQSFERVLMNVVAPEFDGINMMELAAKDPASHVRMTARMQQIQQTMQQIQQEEERQLAIQAQEAEKARAYAVNRSRAILQKEVKEWGDEKYSSILKGAIQHYGFNPKEVQAIIDPRVIKMAHDANEYQKLVSRATAVKKQVKTSTPTLKPGPAKIAQSGDGKRTVAQKNFMRTRSDDDAVAYLQSMGIK